ncbi:MAG: hypothetical protein V3V18_08600 [Methylococcales bacterium]
MCESTDKTEDNEEAIEEEVIHPIASVINEYVHSVLDIRECVERLVPIAVKQLNEEADKINSTLDRGYKLLDGNDDDKKEILAIKTIEEGRRLAKRFKNSHLIEILIESLFINLFSAFDKLTGNLISILYSKRSDLFNTINKEIPLSEVLQMDSLDSLKAQVLGNEIESIRRKSYVDQFKDLEKRFSIKLTKFKTWSLFVEASQRRNLFTHCDGIISQQYLKVCDEVGHKGHESKNVGDQLEIDPQYFYMACIVLTEVGVMLSQTLWRKVLPDELADADNHLQRLIYDFLEWEDWGVAIRLSQFAKNLPEHSDEMTRRINLINYAIALSAIDKKDAAIKLLEKEDWSAMIPDFKLAISVLKEKDGEAVKVMEQIGMQGQIINELAYHEWPLFKEFRNKDCFLNSYEKIYGYPFTEKLNELAEESREDSEVKLAEEAGESSNKKLNSDIQKLRDASHFNAG